MFTGREADETMDSLTKMGQSLECECVGQSFNLCMRNSSYVGFRFSLIASLA
jgi:hypothetical protein